MCVVLIALRYSGARSRLGENYVPPLSQLGVLLDGILSLLRNGLVHAHVERLLLPAVAYQAAYGVAAHFLVGSGMDGRFTQAGMAMVDHGEKMAKGQERQRRERV